MSRCLHPKFCSKVFFYLSACLSIYLSIVLSIYLSIDRSISILRVPILSSLSSVSILSILPNLSYPIPDLQGLLKNQFLQTFVCLNIERHTHTHPMQMNPSTSRTPRVPRSPGSHRFGVLRRRRSSRGSRRWKR
jgi:hypothetical protein